MRAFLSSKTILTFSLGLLFGFLSTTLLERSQPDSMIENIRSVELLDHSKGSRKAVPLSYNSSEDIEFNILDGSTLAADDLYKSVRVLCFILTTPANHWHKAVPIFRTWGRRCNKVIFITDKADKQLPAQTLVIKDATGRGSLMKKTAGAFDHMYSHYLTEFDWFLKADDDTYIVMENLRYFLSHQDTSKPVYFGQWFRYGVKQGYYSGGAGYVLGQDAVRRWGINRGIHSQCIGSQWESGRPDQHPEDVLLGKCMEALGVETASTLDSLGRTRFHCFAPQYHIHGGYPDWYIKTHDKYEGKKKGQKWMSEYAISFHYISPNDLFALDYFIYQVRAYGRIPGLKQLN